MLEKRVEIIDVIVERIRCVRGIGHTVPPLVISHDPLGIAKGTDDIEPDTQIRPQGIGKNQCFRRLTLPLFTKPKGHAIAC
jgi:hypothetical protein